MVLCQIPTISLSNLGVGAIDRCITTIAKISLLWRKILYKILILHWSHLRITVWLLHSLTAWHCASLLTCKHACRPTIIITGSNLLFWNRQYLSSKSGKLWNLAQTQRTSHLFSLPSYATWRLHNITCLQWPFTLCTAATYKESGKHFIL